jgi:hypothetical protein
LKRRRGNDHVSPPQRVGGNYKRKTFTVIKVKDKGFVSVVQI